MPPTIIVPIDVAALVVAGNAAPNTGLAQPLTRFDALPYAGSAQAPFNGETAVNQLPIPDDARNVGVRVHWAMPDALMHATRKKDPATGKFGPWTFPSLPDMWLVTRVARVAGTPDAVRTWVVDSRFASTATTGVYNVGSRAVPWHDANDTTFQQPPFRWLGRAVPLDDWQRVAGDGERLDRLFAGSFGMVELAAYYPNVANVFGLFDALSDVAIDTGAELCYAVTGWHSSAADDPLAGLALADAVVALKDRSWSVGASAKDNWAPELTEAPAGTAYCGVVYSVQWKTPDATTPSQLTVAFGNTTSEALSALIVQKGQVIGTDADRFELQLHTFVTGQLPVLGDIGGDRTVKRQLHKQRFTPVTATTTWYVRRSSDGADVSAAQSDALRAQLDDLNQKQAAVDALGNEVQAQRWQVFADWLKWLEVKYGDNPNNLDPDQVASFMQGGDLSTGANGDYGFGGDVVRPDAPLPALETSVASLGTAQKALDTAHTALKAIVAALPSPNKAADIKFALAQKPGEVFYQPSDPTVLLSGGDVEPTLRYGGDTLYSEDGTLACRISSWLVAALSAPAGAVGSSTAAALDARDSSGFGADGGALAGAATAASFLVESLLLWPAWAAGRIAAKAGGDASAWQTWVNNQASAFLAAPDGTASPYAGRKPSPVGTDAWDGNPWLPIMLQWQIEYRPAQLVPNTDAGPILDPRLVLERLYPQNDSLDSDATELTLTGALSNDSTNYLGMNFITPHAGYAVFKKLKEFKAANKNPPANSPTADLVALADAVTPMPLLSQALTGFHDRFLLRRRTLQLEVRDPFSFGDPSDPDDLPAQFQQQVIKAVDAAASQANTTAPMVQDSFCPIRAGTLAIKTVWLIDAFGQYRRFETESNAIATTPARAMSSTRMYPDAPGPLAQALAQPTTFMPPRISQPALLRFNWLSAAGDRITTGTQPSSTPICGWLVPNYLDASLMAYDADGTALGSVAQVDNVVKWIGAPANPSTFGEAAPAAKNQHLLDFLNALIPKGPDYLNAFLDTLNTASSTIQPLQHAQTAQLPVLVGQPLALARVALELKLSSPPAINNSWAAFERDLQAAASSTKTPRTTNGHEDVEFPILVGSLDDPDDGLLGFYLNSSFDTFHAVVPDADAAIPTRKIDSVTVSVAGGPVTLTLIVDPRCDVHATTGYMPTQSLRIPTAMFRSAFDQMAVTFLTAPILTPSGNITLPLPMPGQQNGEWSWISIEGSNGGPRRAQESAVSQSKAGAPFSDPRHVLRDGWLSLKGFED